jgi:hypothetical protein
MNLTGEPQKIKTQEVEHARRLAEAERQARANADQWYAERVSNKTKLDFGPWQLAKMGISDPGQPMPPSPRMREAMAQMAQGTVQLRPAPRELLRVCGAPRSVWRRAKPYQRPVLMRHFRALLRPSTRAARTPRRHVRTAVARRVARASPYPPPGDPEPPKPSDTLDCGASS